MRHFWQYLGTTAVLLGMTGAAEGGAIVHRDALPASSETAIAADAGAIDMELTPVNLDLDAIIQAPPIAGGSADGAPQMVFLEEQLLQRWRTADEVTDDVPEDPARTQAMLTHVELTDFDGWYLLSR